MLHIKSILGTQVSHMCDKCFRNLWRFRSKFSHAVKSFCEFFTHVTNTKWEKYGSTALSCGQWRPMYMLIRIIARHMCYGLYACCDTILLIFGFSTVYWKKNNNKVICFEIKCLRLYTAKEVIIQAKSSKRYAGQWILGIWRHSLATRKPLQ